MCLNFTTAKAILENADSATKIELEAKIENADSVLKKAINELSGELDDLKEDLRNTKITMEKENSDLERFIMIVCVISCIALCSSFALAALFIFSRKRRIK